MSKTLTLLTALLTGSTVFAQKDETPTKTLDEVVVTANKVEQKQSTTGKVITVITKEQLSKSSGKTIAQVLNEQAGITIPGAMNNLGALPLSVFTRGASAGRTLILLDGIPVNDPSQINNDFDLNLFSITDVEQIEVCKGAQSTLYGSDAIGGVINIITTKKNIAKPFNVKATATAGNKSTIRNNLQVYGKANRLTYTARFSRLKTNGFSASYDSTGTKNYDNDGYDGNLASASGLYQLNNHLSVKGFVQFSQYNTGVDASAFNDKRNYNIDNKNLTTGTGFVYKKETWSLTGNYQYSKQNRDYDDNATFPGALNYLSNVFGAITQFAELYTSVNLAKNVTLLAGGDYRFGSMNNLTVSAFSPFPLSVTSFPDQGFNQASLYSSIAYAGKHFIVELGGRYNKHSNYGNNFTYTFNPAFIIDKHVKVFGSIASGFKAPSLYQSAHVNSGKTLNPETSVNYEAGIQQQYANFSHRAVFFYRDIANGIDYNNRYSSTIPNGYFNFARQEARGIEYEVSIHPTTAWNITANYTYTSLEESTQSRKNFNDTGYTYALRRPKHMLNVSTGYQFCKAFYASVTGKYAGKRYDAGGYMANDVLLEGYFILGAYAEYVVSDNLKFFADVQNFTNKKFFDVRGYNSIPVMFNAGLTVDL